MKKSQLHSIAPILSSIDKKGGFKIPEDYFQSVEENVLLTMNFQKVEFQKPVNSFKVPKTYFNTIEEQVLSKLKAEALQEDDIKESSVPDNYFENLEDEVLSKLKVAPNENIFKIKNIIKYVAPLAVAASLILIFMLKTKPETVTFDSLATNEIVAFVDGGFVDLDTENIVTMYSDVELPDNFMTSISEEEAYDYLDEIDVESLMYEN